MKKGILFTTGPVQNVRWSQPMDPRVWSQSVGVVKVTKCLNRFEILADSADVESEMMREWAHERLDEWLNSR